MNASRFSVAAALACLSVAPAFAQGTISSGTTFLQFVGTPFSGTSGNANLLFGSSSAFGTEQLFHYGWAYNQGTGTSNRPFSNALDTPVQTYVGNTATFTWNNAGAGVTGFARWNAVMTLTLTEVTPGPSSTQPGAAIVTSALTFTSNAANSGGIAFSVFHDLDLDIIGASGTGTALNDAYSVTDSSLASGIKGQVTDSGSSNFGQFAGYSATRYEFNTGSALRTRLGFASSGIGSGNLATLAGTSAANWASTDGAVAFQWTQTLAPGESFQMQSAFAINTALPAPVPEPASVVLMAGGVAALLGLRRRRR